MRVSLPIVTVAALVMATSVLADEVSDALQAAGDAYAAGDLGKAGSELALATQALGRQQSTLLAALLPPAPEGWTVTPTEDFAVGFAIAGGGSGAEARYENADQSESFSISFIADNPMVTSMGAMLGNEQMMVMMGTVRKIGEQPVLETDGNLSALVGTRVLFQAQGAGVDVMLPLVQQIDFARVAAFDSR